MPIYEYKRLSDGKIFEVQQSIKDDPLTQCPETGEPVEKVISRSAFHLKGSGWYTTDYKSSSASTASSEKTESAPETQSEKAAAPSSESAKPEKA